MKCHGRCWLSNSSVVIVFTITQWANHTKPLCLLWERKTVEWWNSHDLVLIVQYACTEHKKQTLQVGLYETQQQLFITKKNMTIGRSPRFNNNTSYCICIQFSYSSVAFINLWTCLNSFCFLRAFYTFNSPSNVLDDPNDTPNICTFERSMPKITLASRKGLTWILSFWELLLKPNTVLYLSQDTYLEYSYR